MALLLCICGERGRKGELCCLFLFLWWRQYCWTRDLSLQRNLNLITSLKALSPNAVISGDLTYDFLWPSTYDFLLKASTYDFLGEAQFSSYRCHHICVCVCMWFHHPKNCLMIHLYNNPSSLFKLPSKTTVPFTHYGSKFYVSTS